MKTCTYPSEGRVEELVPAEPYVMLRKGPYRVARVTVSFGPEKLAERPCLVLCKGDTELGRVYMAPGLNELTVRIADQKMLLTMPSIHMFGWLITHWDTILREIPEGNEVVFDNVDKESHGHS